MTLIPRAQTFQSFLSEQTEEQQNQEQATASSGGCDRNCSTSPHRWHPYCAQSHNSWTFQSFRKLNNTCTVWTLYVCMYGLIIICRTVCILRTLEAFLYVGRRKTNAKKLYHKLYFSLCSFRQMDFLQLFFRCTENTNTIHHLTQFISRLYGTPRLLH